MRRALAIAASLACLLAVPSATGHPESMRPQDIADAITELDVARAQRLLDEVPQDSASLAFERARLAIYQGDCDSASAILSAPTYASTKEGASLGQLARRCSETTAASVVVQDDAQGVWIRLQDEGDQALVPYLTAVAVSARNALLRDLGVDLPRPLRLEIVRDVFSLASLSGLPVEAAETTGTIAVARWGRVVIVTPRATVHGYPWEDTLAHEIAHLAITRASGDRAPLWLQEGLAKREETRWRPPRPFDENPYDEVARTALLSGQSVGIENLGPSIAMLPSADAARIAYAEVASFMSYWVAENGEAALRLLLADLRGIGGSDSNAAMRSVTGYELAVWQRFWRDHLTSSSAPAVRAAPASHAASEVSWATSFAARVRIEETVRRMRLGELLFEGGHSRSAAQQFDQAVAATDREAAVRWRAARAWIDAGEPGRGSERLGDPGSVDGACGPWLALRGRILRDRGERAAAEADFRLAIGLHPLSEVVACEGQWRAAGRTPEPRPSPPMPADPARRALCEAARRVLTQD
jgi:hypothetical protein